MPPEKLCENKKGNQIRKFNISSPQRSTKSKVNIVNSGPIAKIIRFQFSFQPNMTRAEEK